MNARPARGTSNRDGGAGVGGAAEGSGSASPAFRLEDAPGAVCFFGVSVVFLPSAFSSFSCFFSASRALLTSLRYIFSTATASSAAATRVARSQPPARGDFAARVSSSASSSSSHVSAREVRS